MSRFLGDIVGKPTHRQQHADPLLPIPLAKVGIEVEVEEWDGTNLNSPLWESKEDHSLRGRSREFVTTGGGLVGTEITRAVTEICDCARRHGFSTGYPRAGIHIHLDITDLDLGGGQLAQLVSSYLMTEHLFFEFAGSWRNYCCYTVPMSIGQWDFESLGRVLYSSEFMNDDSIINTLSRCSKYQALNLECISRYGTVEFRHLPTTFDRERILLWIRMILALKKSAMAKPEHADYRDALSALSHYGVHDYIRNIFGNELYAQLSPYIDPAQVLAAVDNAQLLMAYGGKLGVPPPGGWETVSVDPSPILAVKALKIKEYRTRKSGSRKPRPKKTETPEEMLARRLNRLVDEFDELDDDGDEA